MASIVPSIDLDRRMYASWRSSESPPVSTTFLLLLLLFPPDPLFYHDRLENIATSVSVPRRVTSQPDSQSRFGREERTSVREEARQGNTLEPRPKDFSLFLSKFQKLCVSTRPRDSSAQSVEPRDDYRGSDGKCTGKAQTDEGFLLHSWSRLAHGV